MRLEHKRCPFFMLLHILLQLIIVATTNCKRLSPVSLSFNPPYIHNLVSGHNTTVQLTLQSKQAKNQTNLSLRSFDDDVANVFNTNDQWILEQKTDDTNATKNFTVYGKLLGKTKVCVNLHLSDDILDPTDISNKELSLDCVNGSNGFSVWVVQPTGRVVNHIFLSTLIVLIITANFLMGCELDLDLVLETLKKPIPPLIGLCSQFIAMPLLAYSIATVIFMTEGLYSFALGMFISGCAPGGGASNYWTLLLDGNVPVSITMTFISTLAALVMMPLWIWALGDRFLQSQTVEFHIKIPYANIISSLLTMIIPLLIGICLACYKPVIRKNARKIMRPFLIFVVTFLVGFGAVANLYMFKIMVWRAIFGGLLLPWCGFTVGCFASLLTGQDPKVVTAVAVETGIQNTGIAIMLLKFSFPQPDADISALIPVISASFTPLPLLVMVGIHELIKRLNSRQSNKQSGEVTKELNYDGMQTTPLTLGDGNWNADDIKM
uniref:Ileal sodium/bile acid cotransporter n=1 Tax=Syphacia muris TaxID=451379 RepID=A0A0N5AHU2_9BILA